MKCVITGAQGMLGADLVRVFLQAGEQVIATGRDELDITDEASVREFLERERPDVVINAAADNAVDAIEEDEAVYARAQGINGEAPGMLARACKEVGARFVHYSTEYVFDGTADRAYREDDVPRPISRYGLTKRMGEEQALASAGQVYICRVSKLFGAPGVGKSAKESVVELMLRLARERDRLQVVDEEYGCPTYTLDVAHATYHLLHDRAEPGIYHLINEGEPVTPYGFTKEIFAIAGITTPIDPVPRSQFPRASACPAYAPLVNTKRPLLRTRTEALQAFLHV